MLSAILYAVGAVASFFESRSLSCVLRDLEHIEKRQIEIHEEINKRTNEGAPDGVLAALHRRLHQWQERGATFDERLQGIREQRASRKRGGVLEKARGLFLAEPLTQPKEMLEKPMLEKLKSRKLWMTILGAMLVTTSRELGLNPELVEKLVYLFMTYVLGQGVVDAAEKVKPRVPKASPSALPLADLQALERRLDTKATKLGRDETGIDRELQRLRELGER